MGQDFFCQGCNEGTFEWALVICEHCGMTLCPKCTELHLTAGCPMEDLYGPRSDQNVPRL